jgi:hypothetical protein
MAIRLFCINLKRSVLRRKEFDAMWVKGLGFRVEYFDAVDKHTIPNSDLDRGRRELEKLSFSPYGTFGNHRYSLSGVMGCSLSHKYLLKSIEQDLAEDGVVVFEDDVVPLEGADKLEERISLVRRHSPQIEAIICNGFVEPRRMYGWQILNNTMHGKRVDWDESVHATPIKGAAAALVKISPPGSFFVWYSRGGVARMIDLIEGREFLSVDTLYGAFAHQGVLAILTPGLGYHPSNKSQIDTPPFTMQYAN